MAEATVETLLTIPDAQLHEVRSTVHILKTDTHECQVSALS